MTSRYAKPTTAVPLLLVRECEDDDQPALLELLTTAFARTAAAPWAPEYFRWKHLACPFGRWSLLVAEADDRVVGFRAAMPWRLSAGGRPLRAVRVADAATHPDYRRRGVLAQLGSRARQELPDDVEVVFTFPNELSRSARALLGWQVVGSLPLSVRVRRPIRFALNIRGSGQAPSAPLPVDAETAADALSSRKRIRRLLDGVETGPLLATARDVS